METKNKKFTSLVAVAALVANLAIATAVFADQDSVEDQALVNEGALAVAYGNSTEFFGSINAGPSSDGDVLAFDFATLEFTNTTGTASGLAWKRNRVN